MEERGRGVTLTPNNTDVKNIRIYIPTLLYSYIVIKTLMLFKEIFQMYTKMNYFDAVHPDVLKINQW